MSAVNGNWLDKLLQRLQQVDVTRLSHDPTAVLADPDHAVRGPKQHRPRVVCPCSRVGRRAWNRRQAKLPALVGDAPSAGSRQAALPDTGKRERSAAEVDDARQRYLQRKMQRKR